VLMAMLQGVIGLIFKLHGHGSDGRIRFTEGPKST
jgi:hypothetical protein